MHLNVHIIVCWIVLFVCLFASWKIMSENSAPKLGVKMAIHGIIFFFE